MVNPLGIAEPMVGWKRAPLSAVTSHLVFSDKCLYLVSCIEYLGMYAHGLNTYKWFLCKKCLHGVLIGNGGCMLMLE